jgi:hypothetical protein
MSEKEQIIVRDREIGFNDEFIPIDEVIFSFVKAKEDGYTHVDFDVCGGWEFTIPEVEINVYERRLETDREYSERLKREEQYKVMKNENERELEIKTLKALKQKYPDV